MNPMGLNYSWLRTIQIIALQPVKEILGMIYIELYSPIGKLYSDHLLAFSQNNRGYDPW